MKPRKIHRMIGAVLILPLLGWAVTGMIFFIKPGYGDAYAPLSPKLYPLDEAARVTGRSDWMEYRVLRTILGDHLLVKTEGGWRHCRLDGTPMPSPAPDMVRQLVEDAVLANPTRYGEIQNISGTEISTSTGVTIRLNWDRLSLSQYGRDTRRIDGWYKIHYLQWTGIAGVDRVLGVVGLVLLVLMAGTGLRLLLERRRETREM